MRFLMTMLAVLALAACHPKEEEQRRLIKEFLTDQVINRPGERLRQTTSTEQGVMQGYLQYYEIIFNYHEQINSVLSDWTKLVPSNAFASVQDIIKHKDAIQAAYDATVRLQTASQEALAKAQDARAKLSNNADIQPVFDRAFDVGVNRYAKALEAIIPLLKDVWQDTLAFNRFYEQNQSKIYFNGDLIEADSPSLKDELLKQIILLDQRKTDLTTAQEKLFQMIQGDKEKAAPAK